MKIDVWYDVVCPWCWLGKARLDAAVAKLSSAEKEHAGTVVVSHSFELDPSTPADLDISATERVAKKYGVPIDSIHVQHQRITKMGREVGIEYNFDRVRTANTFDAHQLVHFARAAGGEAKANDMADRLFVANFRDGLRVGHRDVLVRLAKEAGLDETDAAAALEEKRFADLVRRDETDARELGIGGVPFFIFEGKVAVSGAQPIEVLERALSQTLDP